MANPDQQRIQDQMRERREEQLLFQRFQNVATRKLEQVSRQAEITKQINNNNNNETSNGIGGGSFDQGLGRQVEELKMGEEEQKVISRMAGMGLREGILAGIASFVVLRRGPRYIGRWVQRRQQQQSASSSSTSARSNASYQLSDPKQLTTNNNPFEKAANAKHFPRPRGLLSRSIWFVFDAVLSLMVGANVSMVYTDKKAIRKQVAELPLVSGRSLTADTLCDEVVRELKLVRDEKDPTYERLEQMNKDTKTEPTAAAFFMEGIVLFCQNCERRRYLERRIREENGWDKTVPVKIPSPGVPVDSPRLVANGDGTESVVGQDGTENPFLEQYGRGMGWDNTTNFGSDDSFDGDQDRRM